jgi:hypothetical protein
VLERCRHVASRCSLLISREEQGEGQSRRRAFRRRRTLRLPPP